MTAPDHLVAVGASAGGVEALREFVAHLPADFPAVVCVVLHIPATAPSALAGILDRAGPLPALAAVEGSPLQAGTVVVAGPGHHLLVDETSMTVSRGPKENGHRPSVDVLFRSAARWWGPRASAVVLTGTLDDGAAGAAAVAARGGQVYVQDPATALYTAMPNATLAAVPNAVTGTSAELAKLLAERPLASMEAELPMDPTLAAETDIARLDEAAHAALDRPGVPAGVGCPDCGGPMFELESEAMVRFRCRVGHAWSPDSLTTRQAETTEAALWTAIRTLEDSAVVHRRLAERRSENARARYLRRAAEAEASAATIRALLRTEVGAQE